MPVNLTWRLAWHGHTGIQLKIPANVQVDKQALQPGTDVKVSYDTQGSEHIVTAIEVHPAMK